MSSTRPTSNTTIENNTNTIEPVTSNVSSVPVQLNRNVNTNNTAIKRIMRECVELQRHPSTEYTAAPLDDNLFEWHFTLRGVCDSVYAGGLYHGRILLPSTYPFKPPDIMLLTPSGRFECNTKICLSITSYHEKEWQPSWSIRTVLSALQSFFVSPPNGAIGALDYPADEKRALAIKSRHVKCYICNQTNEQMLPDTATNNHTSASSSSSSGVVAPGTATINNNNGTDIPVDTLEVASCQQIASTPHTDTLNTATALDIDQIDNKVTITSTVHKNPHSALSPSVNSNTGLRHRINGTHLNSQSATSPSHTTDTTTESFDTTPTVTSNQSNTPSNTSNRFRIAERDAMVTVSVTGGILLILLRKLFGTYLINTPAFSFEYFD